MCASVSKQAVIRQLQVLLKGADLESTTEEVLHKQLSSHFRQDMGPFTDDIQAEIENFVVKSASPGAGQGSKRGRENCDPDQSAKKNAKVEQGGEQAKDFPLSENGLIRCAVKEFKGRTYVDIRTHYKAVEEKDLTYKVSLAEKRQATVTDFIKGTISVDVREYYGAGEECKPSPKGVMLKEPVFKVLCSVAGAITAALPEEDPNTAAPAVKAEAGTSGAPAPIPASTSGGASAAGASTVTTQSGETLWWLGGSLDRNVKLAGATTFQEKRCVAVREHYQKDGAWLPGSKGLNLTPEQFETLCSHQQEISDAVAAKDVSLQVALSDSRTVALNLFKGKVYTHIRERSKTNADPCRGKGIGLSADEWGKLAAVLPEIQASLKVKHV